MSTHVVTDPRIQHGPYRVLQQTTGDFIVADVRKPAGQKTVQSFPIERFSIGREASVIAARAAAERHAQALAEVFGGSWVDEDGNGASS